jgi:undecaprenyl-diphosphatase
MDGVRSDLIDDALASDLVDDPTRSGASEPRAAEVTAKRRRVWGERASLAAVALGSIGTFVALTRAIRWDESNAFDRAVVRSVGRARGPTGNVLARAITFFGAAPGAASVSLAALLLARRRPRLAWQIGLGALGGITAELGFKRIFRRKRPTLLAHLEDVYSTSFPSGHSMAAASLYLTLAFVASRSPRFRTRRGTLLAGGGALATSVGASRVYLGVHWPTDVIGGLVLGTAWACIAEAGFDLTGADRMEREAARTIASRREQRRRRPTPPPV